MSWEATDAVLRGGWPMPDLDNLAALTISPGTCWRVLVVLAHHLDERTGLSWPSRETIAAESMAHRRTVDKALSALADSGAIQAAGKGPRGVRQWSLPWHSVAAPVAAVVAAVPRHKPEPETTTGDALDLANPPGGFASTQLSDQQPMINKGDALAKTCVTDDDERLPA